jgi:hypothetical protein
LHDFNPGILPDGLFWIVRASDDALQLTGDTVKVRLHNVPTIDTFTFYDPLPPSGNVPSVTSFTQTYTRSGSPRQVKPTSVDPVSAFNWAGEMWMATASVTFSVAHADGSFSAQGAGESNGQFGEVGFERNGVFLTQ